ncbi:MAG: rhodanese-like domain-containing protein [Saprospiraceae bacterium]
MTLQEVIKQPGTTIVDVREPFEFVRGHAEGAINIPLGTIPSRLEEFKSMSKPILLYCASGNRSGQATNYLNSCGVPDAFNGGGLNDVYFLAMQMQS